MKRCTVVVLPLVVIASARTEGLDRVSVEISAADPKRRGDPSKSSFTAALRAVKWVGR